MRRWVRAASAIAVLVTVAAVDQSCSYRAPFGRYQGVYPAPGAITAFDTVPHQPADETKAGAPAFLLPKSTNAALFKAGTLWLDETADSVVIIVYGDNRPGFRMMSTPWGVPAVLNLGSRDFSRMLVAFANIPVALVQGIVPKLDLFRDLWSSLWSHRFTGGGELKVLRAIEQELQRNPLTSFVVQTGDVVENGRRGGQWEDFAKRHATMRQSVPYLATVGNHERTWDPIARENWNAVMGPPAQPERYWFAVDFPESIARFCFIDTNILADPSGHYDDEKETSLAEEQLAWLDSALAVPARYRFIVQHHPLVTSGHYLSDWSADDSREEEVRRRARVIEICRRRRVTAVLAGHEHLYQRTYIRGRDGKGFWHITTGGGGSPLYRLSKRERKDALNISLPDSSQITWNREQTAYHFSRLTIVRRPKSGEEKIRLDVFKVNDNGSTTLIDHVDLTKPPS